MFILLFCLGLAAANVIVMATVGWHWLHLVNAIGLIGAGVSAAITITFTAPSDDEVGELVARVQRLGLKPEVRHIQGRIDGVKIREYWMRPREAMREMKAFLRGKVRVSCR